ncbi:hypothetical protein BGZ83_011467 [Gryganskiella cystojenkinii]|nr:hypothetical protein BGZ83_011467 [Gryganskiella cystojenkinii]
MADRKATNKYYPPDWDPSKGSINTYHGQHPLRDRARKLDQGILIVRFELPYNIWCNGCNHPIGMGVRYNAEKKKVGNYYSTAILSFRMKCHLCDNWFEIRTDPKNSAYVVTAGARKKIEDFDPQDNETIELDTPDERERRANDKFAKLEHAQLDANKARVGATVLTRLQNLNDRQWSDPYALSQRLRKKFREEKKAQVALAAECRSVADRVGFAFEILPESEQDRERSKMIRFDAVVKAKMELRLRQVKTADLFAPKAFSGADAFGQPLTRAGSKRTEPRTTTRSKSKHLGLATLINNNNDEVVKTLATAVNVNARLLTDPFLTGLMSNRCFDASDSRANPVVTSKSHLRSLVSYGSDDDGDNAVNSD